MHPAIQPNPENTHHGGQATSPIVAMIVEDDLSDRTQVRRLLKRATLQACELSEFSTATDAWAALSRICPQCILLDLNLPDENGMDFMARVLELEPGTAPSVVVLTGDESKGLGVQAMRAGASDFIEKQDLNVSTLGRAIQRALSDRDARQTKAQLERAEKFAVLGRQAAGVAHEINNPATFVTVNLKLMAEMIEQRDSGTLVLEVAEASEFREMLADSREGVHRITSVVRELQAQARSRVKDEVELVCLDDLVRGALRLLKPQLERAAPITLELGAGGRFLGDRVKLAQVVTNLVINAAQATGPKGMVLVTTSEDESSATLDVEDDGPGIPPSALPRIFEPFFSTKSARGGMGLGLALCARYVEQHDGTISVDESKLGGARFRIEIPKQYELENPASDVPSGVIKVVAGRRPRLLVIDADSGILKAFARVLSGQFDLMFGTDPRQALEHLAVQDVDAVIADLDFPDLDGPAFCHQIRAHSDPMIIFCSSATPDEAVASWMSAEGIVVFGKPIEFDRLKAVLPKSATSSSPPED